jgi:hypothetical protein
MNTLNGNNRHGKLEVVGVTLKRTHAEKLAKRMIHKRMMIQSYFGGPERRNSKHGDKQTPNKNHVYVGKAVCCRQGRPKPKQLQ